MKVRQVVVLFQHCPINVAAGELVSCHSLLSFCTNISLYSKKPPSLYRTSDLHHLANPPAPADTTDIRKKMQKFTVCSFSYRLCFCVNKIESQPTKLLFFRAVFITWISPFFTSASAPKFTMQPRTAWRTSPKHLERTGQFQRQTAGGRLTLRVSRRMRRRSPALDYRYPEY